MNRVYPCKCQLKCGKYVVTKGERIFAYAPDLSTAVAIRDRIKK